LNSTSKDFIFSQTEFRRRSEISPTISSKDAGIDLLNFSVDSITVPGDTSGKDRVPLYVFDLEVPAQKIETIEK
jgi:hypothetical protein